jgi:hypothetical protein
MQLQNKKIGHRFVSKAVVSVPVGIESPFLIQSHEVFRGLKFLDQHRNRQNFMVFGRALFMCAAIYT